MEDFIFSSVGQGSKNGSVVHPFSQNARPIPKLPLKTKIKSKNQKIAKGGGVAREQLAIC
jgi:hypothetical protein